MTSVPSPSEMADRLEAVATDLEYMAVNPRTLSLEGVSPVTEAGICLSEAAALIRGLVEERDELREVNMDLAQAWEGAEARALSAEARLSEAVGVMEPFGAFAPPAFVPDSHAMTQGSPLAKKQVTAGDFRRVAAFLSGNQEFSLSHASLPSPQAGDPQASETTGRGEL